MSPLSLLLQPAPLVLHPGPIYAVDGDRGINQRVLYSIVTGECVLEPCLCILDPGGLARGQSQWGPQTSGPWTEREASPPPIFAGQDDGTFAIGADSGNLTMTRSVPSPKTFTLLVKVGALAWPPWGRGFEDLLVAEASPTPRVPGSEHGQRSARGPLKGVLGRCPASPVPRAAGLQSGSRVAVRSRPSA